MDLDYRNNSSCFDTLFYIFLISLRIKILNEKLNFIKHAKMRANKVKSFLSKFLSQFPMTKHFYFAYKNLDMFLLSHQGPIMHHFHYIC